MEDAPDREAALDDDDFSGDASERDLVDQFEAPRAEDATLHVVEEELADFDSEVDDPQLEAAWELDPEVER